MTARAAYAGEAGSPFGRQLRRWRSLRGLAAVQSVLTQVLARHEPFPAWVVRRPFTFLHANRAADALFPGLTELTPEHLVDLWFGPGPFRDTVQNWPDVVRAGLAALRRDATTTDDPHSLDLLRRALAASGTGAASHPFLVADPGAHSPVVCPVFTLDGRTVRTISAVMTFETAVEVTTDIPTFPADAKGIASQLRIELMFPADEAAESFFRYSRRQPGATTTGEGPGPG